MSGYANLVLISATNILKRAMIADSQSLRATMEMLEPVVRLRIGEAINGAVVSHL
jgi:hypothetical protein